MSPIDRVRRSISLLYPDMTRFELQVLMYVLWKEPGQAELRKQECNDILEGEPIQEEEKEEVFYKYLLDLAKTLYENKPFFNQALAIAERVVRPKRHSPDNHSPAKKR